MTGLTAQFDYTYYIFAFCLLAGAGECLILASVERGAGWARMAGFTLAHALTFLARSAITTLGGGTDSHLAVSILNASSFLPLLWFALPPRGKERTWVVLCAGIGCAATAVGGLVGGEPGLSAAGAIGLGTPAGIIAAAALLPRIRSRRPGAGSLTVLAAALALLGACSAVSGIMVAALPQAIRVPGRLLDGLLSTVLAGALVAYDLAVIRSAVRALRRPLSSRSTLAMIAVFPALLGLGWLLTRSLTTQARAILHEEAAVQSQLHAAIVVDLVTEVDGVALIIAGAPSVVRYLEDPTPAGRRDLTSTLDGFRTVLHSVIGFVVDTRGVVVASSDAGEPGGLAGRHLGQWHPVADALAGRRGGDFAVGPVHASRSYHATVPIRDAAGLVIGAAGVIRDLRDAEARFGSSVPFFLASPDGVVYLTRQPDALLHPLWPLSSERRTTLDSSGMFGVISTRPLLPREPRDGEAVAYRGVAHLVSRVALGHEGWSIVLLLALQRLSLYRLSGISATLMVSLIVLGFSLIGKANLLAAARLRRSQTRYRTLVESSPDWVGIVDGDGTWRFVNSAGLRALDRPAGKVVGQDSRALLGAAAADTLARAQQTARDVGKAELEIVVAGARASRTWEFTAVALPEVGSRKESVMLIGTDVTDRREAEIRLVRAERQAALGSLATGIAHHFNNIHMAALGSLAVAQAEPGLPVRAAEHLTAARGAFDRAALIIDRLLALADAPAATTTGTQLAQTVSAAIARSAGDLEREGVVVHLELRDDRTVAIRAPQLVMIVETLLSNARHALLGRPRREIRIATASDDGGATLRIEDTGIGIAPERLGSIFTPFSTDKGEHAPHGSPQAGVRGLGLGLAVVQSLLRGYGGSIEAASRPGAGATFTVRLPCGEGGS